MVEYKATVVGWVAATELHYESVGCRCWMKGSRCTDSFETGEWIQEQIYSRLRLLVD